MYDSLIMADAKETLNEMLQEIMQCFEIKIKSAFVEMQINRDRSKNSLRIHQTVYINRNLERFNMRNTKSYSLYAINKVSRYMSNYDVYHWCVVQRIFRYLNEYKKFRNTLFRQRRIKRILQCRLR